MKEPQDDTTAQAEDATDLTGAADGVPGADPGAPGGSEPASGGVSGVPLEPAPSKITRLQDELAASKDQYLRLAAEFDNFRKRVARERVELGDRAQANFVLRLLEVLDDLDRLVEQDVAQTDRDVLHQALVLVDRKLRKELAAAGLEAVDAAGAAFDPSVHEAVSAVPPPAPEQDQTIAAVFQAGYRFKGQLVRPARVQVFIDQGQD